MPRRKGYDRKEDTDDRLAKLRGKIPHDWEDLDALDHKALKEKIVECQTNLVESQREMATDTDYIDAKHTFANVAAPYKEAKSRLTNLAQYAILLLEDKGK